jgi:Cu-Zn family superoxide dismutase
MRASLIVAGVAVLASGCMHKFSEAPKATAELSATKNSIVRGYANFVQLGDKVRVTVTLTGLAPNGEFGFHIHEVGDCSSGDGMSTKGHFNPFGKPHGQAGMMERHAGDLPSIRSDKLGHVAMVTDVEGITLTPGPASIIGRGLIVHAQADDYRTQPTGNAGARNACGVIKAVEAPPQGPVKGGLKPPAKEPAKEPAKPAAKPG